jgi:hypothetical protein
MALSGIIGARCWLRLQTRVVGRWPMDAALPFLQQQRGTSLRIRDWDCTSLRIRDLKSDAYAAMNFHLTAKK